MQPRLAAALQTPDMHVRTVVLPCESPPLQARYSKDIAVRSWPWRPGVLVATLQVGTS
jgi:hypothetical protein